MGLIACFGIFARLTEVEGSEYAPYAVTIDLHEGGVAAARCSCPYDWGGVCKHIVAVLLKYLDAPDAVAERPSVDEMLQGFDREALSALLVKRAGVDPALAPWLEAELAAAAPGRDSAGARRTAVDPEPIRRQARALLSGRHSRRRGWSDEGATVDEEAFAALIDKARPFLEAGDGRNALNILKPVTEELVPVWREQADWDETLHEFFPVLGQMIAEAVLMSDLLPDERDDLMVRLDVWQGMLDEYGLDEHLQVAIDALEQGWDEIGLDDVLAGRGRHAAFRQWRLDDGPADASAAAGSRDQRTDRRIPQPCQGRRAAWRPYHDVGPARAHRRCACLTMRRENAKSSAISFSASIKGATFAP